MLQRGGSYPQQRERRGTSFGQFGRLDYRGWRNCEREKEEGEKSFCNVSRKMVEKIRREMISSEELRKRMMMGRKTKN